MTTGRALAVAVDELVGQEAGNGRHGVLLGVVALDVGVDGEVGAEEVGLLVGALDVVGADEVWCVLGGGGGGGGGWWSVCLAGTLAAGGNDSSGTPTRSRSMTAAQVAVG